MNKSQAGRMLILVHRDAEPVVGAEGWPGLSLLPEATFPRLLLRSLVGRPCFYSVLSCTSRRKAGASAESSSCLAAIVPPDEGAGGVPSPLWWHVADPCAPTP